MNRGEMLEERPHRAIVDVESDGAVAPEMPLLGIQRQEHAAADADPSFEPFE